MTTDKLREEQQLLMLQIITTWARNWEEAFNSPEEALIAIVDKCHQVLEEQ